MNKLDVSILSPLWEISANLGVYRFFFRHSGPDFYRGRNDA